MFAHSRHHSPALQNALPKKYGRSHTLELHVRLEQENVPLLDELAQLSSRLYSLHLLQRLLDRTPGMDQTLRSLKLRELDFASILGDSADVGVADLAKCSPKG
jgi:hypothetical protein